MRQAMLQTIRFLAPIVGVYAVLIAIVFALAHFFPLY